VDAENVRLKMDLERQESSKARLHTEAGEATRLHTELSRVQSELSRSQNETTRLQAELARAAAESERVREKYEAGQQDIVRLKMAIEKSEGELQVRFLFTVALCSSNPLLDKPIQILI